MLIYRLITAPHFAVLRYLQCILALLIYLTGALSSSPPGLNPNTPDILLHFLGNFLLFASMWVALRHRMPLSLLLLILIPFSIIIELGQGLVPNRQVDWRDGLANSLGVVCAFAICFFIHRWLKKSNQTTN